VIGSTGTSAKAQEDRENMTLVFIVGRESQDVTIKTVVAEGNIKDYRSEREKHEAELRANENVLDEYRMRSCQGDQKMLLW